MRLLAWFTRNWADTDEPGDSALAPIVLPLPLAQAFPHVQEALRSLPHWHLEASDAQAATIHATRQTRLWRFVDDIHIRLETVPDGTKVHARSQSRVGRGDFGQNRRNLLELLNFLAP